MLERASKIHKRGDGSSKVWRKRRHHPDPAAGLDLPQCKAEGNRSLVLKITVVSLMKRLVSSPILRTNSCKAKSYCRFWWDSDFSRTV